MNIAHQVLKKLSYTLLLMSISCSQISRKENKDLSQVDQKLANLDKKIEDVKTEMEKVENDNDVILGAMRGKIDLTSINFQRFSEGFFIYNISVEKHLTGVKVSGKIFNGTTIIYENLRLNLKIGDRSNLFFIARVLPAGGAGFSCYVPDVDPKDIQNAFLAIQDFTVRI